MVDSDELTGNCLLCALLPHPLRCGSARQEAACLMACEGVTHLVNVESAFSSCFRSGWEKSTAHWSGQSGCRSSIGCGRAWTGRRDSDIFCVALHALFAVRYLMETNLSQRHCNAGG